MSQERVLEVLFPVPLQVLIPFPLLPDLLKGQYLASCLNIELMHTEGLLLSVLLPPQVDHAYSVKHSVSAAWLQIAKAMIGAKYPYSFAAGRRRALYRVALVAMHRRVLMAYKASERRLSQQSTKHPYCLPDYAVESFTLAIACLCGVVLLTITLCSHKNCLTHSDIKVVLQSE